MMLMKVKDLTPRRYESLYEIAYLLFGRASIFIINSMLMFASGFCCVMFYMLLAENFSLLILPAAPHMTQSMGQEKQDIVRESET